MMESWHLTATLYPVVPPLLVPVDIKDDAHEISEEAKKWNEIHKQGKLTTLVGYDPYCYDGAECIGSEIAIGTYWAQSKIHMALNSWTSRGRHGTIDVGCEGPWCTEYSPGFESGPTLRPSTPQLDTVNTIDPDLETMIPMSMG